MKTAFIDSEAYSYPPPGKAQPQPWHAQTNHADGRRGFEMNGAPPKTAAASPITGNMLPVVRRPQATASSPAFLELEPERRRELAEAMVTVCQRAALLLSEEIETDAEIQQQAAARPAAAESRSPPRWRVRNRLAANSAAWRLPAWPALPATSSTRSLSRVS